MATTARDIVYRALEDVGVIGVGQSPLAEDMNYGLNRFNAMIGQFNRRRWLVYTTKDVICTSTGNSVYTLGIGQDFDTPIVDKLEDGCFFRQYTSAAPVGGDFSSDFNNDFGLVGFPDQTPSNATYIDYPLRLIESREQYNRIAMKNLTSWPGAVFYNYANVQLMPVSTPVGTTVPTNPAGYVHLYPVPIVGQFEIHLNVKEPLSTLTNLSTVLLTPPEYEEAFEYNLALRFAAKYNVEASKEVIGLARASLATIRAANTRVPELRLPGNLTGSGARYSIFSDRNQ